MLVTILMLAALVQTEVPMPTPRLKPPAGASADGKICRTQKPVGSRIGGKRVCRTPAEWRDVDVTTMENVIHGKTR